VEYPNGIARQEAEQRTAEQGYVAESFVPLLPAEQVAELDKLWWLSADVD
jgi:hypothetical protein